MENPTKTGKYTTIFADGSVILENFFMGNLNKWYWNEEASGGIVAWTNLPEGGYKKHNWYKIPDYELRELVVATAKYEAIEQYCDKIDQYLNGYLLDEGFSSYEQIADEQIRDYYEGYKCSD